MSEGSPVVAVVPFEEEVDDEEMPPLEHVEDADVEMSSETQHDPDVKEEVSDSDSMGTTLCLDDFPRVASPSEDEYEEQEEEECHDEECHDEESDDGTFPNVTQHGDMDNSDVSSLSSEQPVSDREDFEAYNPQGLFVRPRPSQEVVEMCLALMQDLQDNHPDIMK